MAALLSIGGLLLGCMIGVSLYAAKTLPRDVRIPVHTGFTGRYNNYVSRTAGLITWPAAGLLIYAIMIAVGHVKPNHASITTALIIMVAVLALLLASQVGAIRAARGSTPGRSE